MAKKTSPSTSATGKNLSRWIAQAIEEEPPRSKSLVVTVLGDSIAPHGGEIWLGNLIALLEPFKLSDRLVRTSVFRLAEEGWIESRREGRRASYALTASGRKRFEHAHKRIYTPPVQTWNGRWTLVLSPRNSGEFDRVELRRELAWQGFAVLGQGVLAHPAPDRAALKEILVSLDLLDKLFVLEATELPGFGARPAQDLVSQCWNLESLAETYRNFLAHFEPMLAALRGKQEPDALEAFQVRTLLIHAFRRAILHDPQLPAEILPADWPGGRAYDLCRELYALSSRQAETYLASMLGTRKEPLPPAEAYFFKRFGGISL